MKSSLPKVLHEIAGRPLLGHAVATAAGLDPQHLLVVIGHGRDQVAGYLAEAAPSAVPVVQERQLGTGHAVRTALSTIDEVEGTVVVTYGDVPLLTTDTLTGLIDAHLTGGCGATVLTAVLPDPSGLGRIIRSADGTLAAIVEERDATAEQRAIGEINSGIYVFDGKLLREALTRLSTANAQGEEYLTDVIGVLRTDGHQVAAVPAGNPDEALGVNDRVELARAGRLLNDRLLESWMRAGVTIIDPATTWIDSAAELEPEVTLHPGTRLEGGTVIRTGAVVGPDCTLRDTEVGTGALVRYAVANGAEIGQDATVGPYVYLRPGTKLGAGAHVGTFVEMKNADVGTGTKVPHLSYIGDATIGEHTNIGAATVIVNYDGVAKHHTVIGSHARTGADNMFVAPVTVGDGAYTAAGSVITDDVPPGAMGVGRARQRNIAGWVERRRAGTPAAEAAARARRHTEQTEAGQTETTQTEQAERRDRAGEAAGDRPGGGSGEETP
ncbi:MAG: bifunctional UDP-N-acetylglucosamine diphosphorylase/glucosamine-1-phosphate N-acetyltransferase GlmU [Sporichthyaceae bacterium]|nr:bifunctional UDP-N-acetylglucosamine diphosphorylase/glucosamine-1-phosphate N-acetyltransferase GlmU [Sporichthyaceae bacterium]